MRKIIEALESKYPGGNVVELRFTSLSEEITLEDVVEVDKELGEAILVAKRLSIYKL